MKIKAAIGLLLFLIIFSVSSVFAVTDTVSLMTSAYDSALSLFGRSNFDGYCGACVGRQLQALGVTRGYEGNDGNQTFDHYKTMTATTGGYAVTNYSSEEYSLREVLTLANSMNQSGELTMMALGFQTGSASKNGQRYGHTVLIYSVFENMVYYTESYESIKCNNIKVKSIDEFVGIYCDRPETAVIEYTFEGASWFWQTAEAVGLPYGGWVCADKAEVKVAEPVAFAFNVGAAELLVLSFEKNGVKNVVMLPNQTENWHTASFMEPGVYTVHVIGYNMAGHTVSEAITVTVTE
ncbi:MAG: hypothetical protein II359_00965 [Clostridia bacterium]|nr:hypothetical protein [Clostridia bacterium]